MNSVFRILLLSLIVVTVSCATAAPDIEEGLPELEYISRNIEDALSNSDPTTALLLIDNTAAESVSSELLEVYRSRSEKLLNDLYRKSIIEQDYEKAYAYTRTAAAAGLTLQAKGMDRAGYLLSMAAKSLSTGDTIPALIYFDEVLANTAPEKEILEQYARIAFDEKWFSILQKIIAVMDGSGIDVPAEYREAVNQHEAPAIKLAGMATVWVNRGIRIEGGVGMPDQVIGSGFFIDRRGYLLTNHHVIASEVDPKYEGFSRLYVRLPGNMQTKIPARVVGYDSVFDIALLKTEVTPSTLFSLSLDEKFTPGEQIYAIGSPLGLESTITSGIISATGRRLLQLGDTIQVDVPINSGNSGGPLFNKDGKIVGIVFAGIEQYEGINFAIPAEWIAPLLPKLYEGGEIRHPWIGYAMNETSSGLEIMYNMPGDLRKRTGLRMGDIITEIGGTPVGTLKEAQRTVLSLPIGSLTRITYLRNGEKYSTLAMIEERPENPIMTALEKDSRDNILVPLFGMALSPERSGGLKKTYSIERVFSGSVADEIGLSENDPMTILDWHVDRDAGYAAIQIYVKKKKAGFIETAIQLAAYLELDNFI